MSLSDIEIARLRIEEARQYGMRESYIRRALAEAEGEKKEGWLTAIAKWWRKKAYSQRLTADSERKKLTANG